MAVRFGDLPGIVITFVIVGVVSTIGLAIESDIKGDIETDYGNHSVAANASGDAIDGTAELTNKLPLIGLVIGFAIVLGVILNMMSRR